MQRIDIPEGVTDEVKSSVESGEEFQQWVLDAIFIRLNTTNDREYLAALRQEKRDD